MPEKVLVTGGAGFIGSHLCEALAERGWSIRVLDNLSSGSLGNLSSLVGRSDFQLVAGDCLNGEDVIKALKGCKAVFHLAANPEVRVGLQSPEIHFQQNVLATWNVLELVRKHPVEALVFTSTSTVYGDARQLPTPEDYGPLAPISVYGASKLACEALISSYSHTFGIRSIIFRLANIVGERSMHGVLYDFVNKLRENPRRLEVLGDGRQTKSYLHVEDCIRAMLVGFEKSKGQYELFNVGSEDAISVASIAAVTIEEMNLRDVKIEYTGGVEGGRGWIGDVKEMWLDISRLKALGWKPKYKSREAVRLALREMLDRRR